MSQVLYRKWRPQRLDQVVGQEHVTRTLRQAVAQGRVAHAYLFCGPRGTGKTSTARILAKAVNCQSPQEGEPDNACPMCVAITEGRALDLIEIDAASNRGIDDIRDLRENVRFSPNEARYKFYIVDEVHMLTEYAFNALLKTLEEPPDHAIFVLATTEVHKVPATILSRCQRFDFRRIPLETVAAKLADICRSEGVEAEEEALLLLARSSAGGLRDAENLLEQALVTFGSPLRGEHVRGLLGLGDEAPALRLVECLLTGRLKEGLAAVGDLVAAGGDVRQLHRSTVEYLRAVLLLKTGAAASLGYGQSVEETLRSLASSSDLGAVTRALHRMAEVDFRRDPFSPLPLELALVEAIQGPPATARGQAPAESSPAPAQAKATSPRTPPPSARPAEAGGRTARRPARPRPTTPRDPLAETPTPPPPFQEAPSRGPMPPGPLGRLEKGWPGIVRALSRYKGRRFNLGALLRSCVARELDDESITLRFAHKSHLERMQDELEDPECRRRLGEAIAQVLGERRRIQVAMVREEKDPNNHSAARSSHLVRAAQNMGWRIVDEIEEGASEQADAEAGPTATEADDEATGGA